MREAKQVLVVRKDLKMRKGKVAAQCAHASMKVLLDLATARIPLGRVPMHEDDPDPPQHFRAFLVDRGSPLESWLDGAFAKICVYVESEEDLDAIHRKAVDAGLLSSLIVDSGRTEFHGVPTKTVVAVGPGWWDEVDEVTGHLPLL
jgi:PTH2 family peptidyl-tRNA hydrolase